MTRVLLLDDSLTILKVVRLTFTSTPGVVVDVAKTEAEAREALAKTPPDVVIGYARFCNERTVDFFEEVRSSCKNIVVLTESNENIQGFVSRGFSRFLKKPFHSEELRKAVGEDMPSAKAPSSPTVDAKTPFEVSSEVSSLELSEAQDKPTTIAKLSQMVPPNEVPTVRPSTPPPPPPLRQGTLRAPPHTPGFDGGAATRLAPPPPPQAPSDFEVGIPQITMDVESLERSYRATLTQRAKSEGASEATVVTAPKVVAVSEKASTHNAEAQSTVRSVAPEVDSPLSFTLPRQHSTQSPDSNEDTITFSGVGAGAELSLPDPQALESWKAPVAIELGAPPSEPMELEDVVVSTPAPARSDADGFTNPFRGTRPDPAAPRNRSAFHSLGMSGGGSGGISRAEIEATIDDVLMRSLERAVPAKIESKFDQEWNRMALDVAGRLKGDVAAAMRQELSSTLRSVIENEVRRELQSWMSREVVGMAKEVVREEIRRLIEE